jgi:Cdc6-like AAA superfamily ATPase
MDWGVKDDDFFDLCQRYLELAEARERALTHDDRFGDGPADDRIADEIEDIDAQQRILMCRILFSDEQDQAFNAPERVEDDTVDATENSQSVAMTAPERETGGTVRGRFALRELAVLLKAPFGKSNSRSG